jgi:hypothetical protein
MLAYCKIFEVRLTAGGQACPCGKPVVGQCTDCGSTICRTHAHSCSTCNHVFCSPCSSFHEKAGHGERFVHSVQQSAVRH